MAFPEFPPRADWPRLRWKHVGQSILAATTIATFLFYLLPGTTSFRHRLAIVAGLFVLVLSVPIAATILRSILVAWQRIWYYPELYRRFETERELSGTLSQYLAEYYAKQRTYLPKRVHWFRDRQEIYLLVHKHSGPQPEIGEAFVAWDRETNGLMAKLRLVEIRPEGYHMKVMGSIHPIWAGSIHDEDMADSPVHTDIIVFKGLRS